MKLLFPITLCLYNVVSLLNKKKSMKYIVIRPWLLGTYLYHSRYVAPYKYTPLTRTMAVHTMPLHRTNQIESHRRPNITR